MINKVIIAEDHEAANLSVQKTVEEMRIKDVDYVFYCDDALSKIHIAKQKGQPYDLLITDLEFEDDGSLQKIINGSDLVSSARAIQPDLLVLIFSGEKNPTIIQKLIRDYDIDAYVGKARHDVQELKSALDALSKRQRYYPQSIVRLLKQPKAYQFTDFDLQIIRLLLLGYQQNQIPEYLRRHNIKPSSLSYREKRLNQIRADLGFTKNEQLALFCKETGAL
jgi:two-component system, NarL family, captular synthesis response regulator RcsB